MIFLPRHGDLGCICTDCEMWTISEQLRRDGWYPVQMVEEEGIDDPIEDPEPEAPKPLET